jgi:hypothetical protein
MSRRSGHAGRRSLACRDQRVSPYRRDGEESPRMTYAFKLARRTARLRAHTACAAILATGVPARTDSLPPPNLIRRTSPP